MKPTKTIYYVTGNPAKFKAFAQFFPASSGISLQQEECHLFEEQTEDQAAIAIAKARQAWQQLGKPVLVDDVGFYFDQYHNFPGAFTKFVYKGLGFAGIERLIKTGDPMHVLLQVVYMWGPGSFKLFTVRVEGSFKKRAEGAHDQNAPFDSVFVPKGYDKSYVELEKIPEIYDEIFYRAIAAREIIAFIKESEEERN